MDCIQLAQDTMQWRDVNAVTDIPVQWNVGDSLTTELLPVSHSGLFHEFC